jgi:predicted DCC family thiol-disulfide oxidoreductase YuxK
MTRQPILIEVENWDRSSAERSLLIYDGCCGFCKRCAAYAQRLVGESRLAVGAAQNVAEAFPELTSAELQKSVWLVQPEGELYAGARAVFEVLAMVPRRGFGLWMYRRVPGFAALSEAAYRWVANHRTWVSTWVNRLWPPT